MRTALRLLTFFFLVATCSNLRAADTRELQQRRQRAAAAFHDGILLLHAKSSLDFATDGFHQDPAFYYFTGLENLPGAILAIDGRSSQSWLFLPPDSADAKIIQPEVSPGAESQQRLGIEHIQQWSALADFLAPQAGTKPPLYYCASRFDVSELPANITGAGAPNDAAPLWLLAILAKWPALQAKEAERRVYALMATESPSELADSRIAATATVAAVMAGIRAIHPDVSQRTVEAVVQNACWSAGARGSSFWPWAMAGVNAVFPRPFAADVRYDHLNKSLFPGELVRLDVGCEWNHYQGDLGRTIPASGRFNVQQRETWNLFVDAYQAGVKSLRDGITLDQVFATWRAQILTHRDSAKSTLAKNAIDSWSQREAVPFWQLHTMNLDAGEIVGPLREGMVIDFEPIASIDGQGFYLEDMFRITATGAELLTPGVPYTADEIETAMK